MTDFRLALEYDRKQLTAALRHCHGLAHVTIAREEDVPGVVRLLLDGAGCRHLRLSDDYTAIHLEGGKVRFALAATPTGADWRATLEGELRRLQEYIDACARGRAPERPA